MQSPTSLESAAVEPVPSASSRSLDASGRIDRYVLQRLLARGGGADVYAATHAVTGTQVALKVPREGAPVIRARFEREIQALARVHGPGVVEMLDAGEADGRQFIVFRALEGRTLSGLLAARGQLGVADTLKVGVALAQALRRCHDAGVIHRDVKPSNVFVGPGPGAQVTLLDFGIAKLADLPRSAQKLTREHTLLGTPEYMAPESLLSSPDADQRADVYGLGVTLYECLTGKVPHEGGYADVLLKLSTSAPAPVEAARPDVPPALAAIIARCLERAPEDRFQTMGELADALAGCVSGPDHTIDLFGREGAGVDHAAQTLADSPVAKNEPEPRQFRRKHPRAPYITLARITTSSGERVDGRIEEVSEGGLQFVGDRSLAVGQQVKIRFSLPATGLICEVAATARWNRTVRGNNATGFEFMEISDGARAELRQYVSIMCPGG